MSGAIAMLLAAWIVRHPSERFDELFERWDHLALAGAAGLALSALPPVWRKCALAAIGAGFLLQYAGAAALGIGGALTLAALGLWRTPLRGHRAAMTVAQVGLVVLVYGFLFWLRTWDFSAAARIQGLLALWLLRHTSLVVAVGRFGAPALSDCSAYMTFYPGSMGLLGGPEVYEEFARRNLARPPILRSGRAARRVLEGVLLWSASALVPITLAQVESSAGALEAWGYGVGLFVHTALGLMGLWRSVEGTALFYGVQLRANFAGLLSCRNPAELWWSWRGSLTNWLVHYVFAPLGGSRRHQSLNIAAAFAASFAWHAIGVPFLSPAFRPAYVVAVALWAGVNGAAVIAHARLERAGALRATALIPLFVRTGVATGLMWALGSLTPILLSYQGPAVSGLSHTLGLLLGLH